MILHWIQNIFRIEDKHVNIYTSHHRVFMYKPTMHSFSKALCSLCIQVMISHRLPVASLSSSLLELTKEKGEPLFNKNYQQ